MEEEVLSITSVNNFDLFNLSATFTGIQKGAYQEAGFVWRRQNTDGSFTDLNFFLKDGIEQEVNPAQESEKITFSANVTLPLFVTTRIRAFLKIDDEFHYSEPIDTSGIDENIVVGTDNFQYQGGFSMTANGSLTGRTGSIFVSQHGFCLSYDGDCPEFASDSCIFIVPEQLNTDSFSVEINNLRNDRSLRVRSFVNLVYDLAEEQERFEKVKLGPCLTFDGNLNFWDTAPQVDLAMAFGVGFSIGDVGYVGLGEGEEQGQHFWSLDPDTEVWTQIQDFGGDEANCGQISAPTAFTIGNTAYVGAGYCIDADIEFMDFRRYDPAANLWTAVDFSDSNEIPTDRCGAVAFSIGDSVAYFGTGLSYDGLLKDFWKFTPSSQGFSARWTKVESEFDGIERAYAVGFTIDGKGYVGTGEDPDGAKLKDFYEFDPLTDTWNPSADFGGGEISNAVAFSILGTGYVGTGRNRRDNPTAVFWKFDPNVPQWEEMAAFAGGVRWGGVGFVLKDQGYVGTGFDENEQFLNTFRVFCP